MMSKQHDYNEEVELLKLAIKLEEDILKREVLQRELKEIEELLREN